MALLARSLTVHTYRNFQEFSLDLDPVLTVLVGHNAQGKTNLVEALQLLTSGMSFRRPSPLELVQEGAQGCSLALRLEGEGRVIDLACDVAEGKRVFKRNGKRTNAQGMRGVVPSVLFCPDDLDMVKRSASVRRAALDVFGIQLNERYAKLSNAYDRVVSQRNGLLKEPWCTPGLLVSWNESLVKTGAALLMHRMSLLGRIRTHFISAYRAIAAHERVDVVYEPTIASGAGAALPDPSDHGEFMRVATSLFSAGLTRRADDELRRGITLVGPHRDEIRFMVDGRDARVYASQGQQRSLVLAWKMAEVAVTRDILGRSPLLLLDDVMSELDADRRDAFLNFIQDEVQTVITTTNLGYFTDEVLGRAKVVHIGKA